MLIWPQPNYRPICVHSQTTDTCETVGHTGCLRSEFLTTGFLHLFLHRQKEQFLFEKFSVALGWTLKRDWESFFLYFRHEGGFSSMQWPVMFKFLFLSEILFFPGSLYYATQCITEFNMGSRLYLNWVSSSAWQMLETQVWTTTMLVLIIFLFLIFSQVGS